MSLYTLGSRNSAIGARLSSLTFLFNVATFNQTAAIKNRKCILKYLIKYSLDTANFNYCASINVGVEIHPYRENRIQQQEKEIQSSDEIQVAWAKHPQTGIRVGNFIQRQWAKHCDLPRPCKAQTFREKSSFTAYQISNSSRMMVKLKLNFATTASLFNNENLHVLSKVCYILQFLNKIDLFFYTYNYLKCWHVHK